MKKQFFLLCMAMISLQAMALQTAKTVSSRQIGDTLIHETVDVYNGIVRDVRQVDGEAPDTVMFRCNRDVDGNAVIGVFEGWWSCQVILQFVKQIGADADVNDQYLTSAINKCQMAVKAFGKGGCPDSRNRALSLQQALIQVYQLSEGEQQMAEAQAVLEHYGDLGELQHCGYLL